VRHGRAFVGDAEASLPSNEEDNEEEEDEEGEGEEETYQFWANGWRAWAATLPGPLLQERALFHESTDAQTRSNGLRRLPVAWLRRHWFEAWDESTPEQRASWCPVSSREELAALRDMCLVPFETTCRLLSHGTIDMHRWQRWMAHWAHELGTFAGLDGYVLPPWPPLLATGDEHVISRAILWRVVVADVAGRRIFARGFGRPDDPRMARGRYEAVLFGDTHLDALVSLATASGPSRVGAMAVTDRSHWFAHKGRALSAVYPLPHRVLCAEELPDLVPALAHANLLYDAGKTKKARPVLMRDVAHLFIGKVMNQICHKRHWTQTLYELMYTHDAIAQLVPLVLRCALLGNFPGNAHTVRLGWAARIRLAMQLPVSAEATRERLGAFMRWIDDHPFTLMFSLREWLVYTCETSVVHDRILGRHFKWASFKATARLAMNNTRAELTRQAAAHGPAAPTRWYVIETPPTKKDKPPDDPKRRPPPRPAGWPAPVPPPPGTPPGLLNKAHQHILYTFVKLRKGHARHVIYKKMTSEEAAVLDYHVWQAASERPDVRALARQAAAGHDLCADDEEEDEMHRLIALLLATTHTDPGATDVELERLLAVARPHRQQCFDAWHSVVAERVLLAPIRARLMTLAPAFRAVAHRIASIITRPGATRRERETPELRWLRPLGVSPQGYAEIRMWFFKYVAYEQPDDRYKHWARLLGKACLYDFIALKLFLMQVANAVAQPSVLAFLSHEDACRQIMALRTRLRVLPHEPTPEDAARGHLCVSCGHWASTLQTPPVWVVHRHDAEGMATVMRSHDALNGGVPLKARDHVHKLVPVGQHRGVLDVLKHGRLMCPRHRGNKEELELDRISAVVAGITPDDDDDEDGVEGELEVRGAEAEAERAIVGSVRGIDDDSDEDDGDEPEEEEEEEADAGTRKTKRKATRTTKKKKTKKKKKAGDPATAPKHVRDRAGALLKSTLAAPLQYGNPTCRDTPLLSVLLRGVVVRSGHRRDVGVTLCAECGDPMHIADDKWTSYGPSCLNHAHVDEFPLDSYEQTAFAVQTMLCVGTATGQFGAPPVEEVAADGDDIDIVARRHKQRKSEYNLMMDAGAVATTAMAAAVAGAADEQVYHPYVLPVAVPCAFCRTTPTRKIIYAYDARLAWYEVGLCDRELRALRAFLPTSKLGHVDGIAVEPVPIEMIAETLARVKMRVSRAAATPTVDEDDDALLDLLDDLEEASPEQVRALELRDQLAQRATPDQLEALLDARPDLRVHWHTLDAVDSPAQRVAILELILTALDEHGAD